MATDKRDFKVSSFFFEYFMWYLFLRIARPFAHLRITYLLIYSKSFFFIVVFFFVAIDSPTKNSKKSRTVYTMLCTYQICPKTRK